MKPQHDRQKLFMRRLMVMAGVKGTLMALLFGRLYSLSVLDSQKYLMMAEENRIDLRFLMPKRGGILDRKGEYLARNNQNFRVILVPEQTVKGRPLNKKELLKGVTKTLNKLVKIVALSEYNYRRVLNEATQKLSFMPIKVMENLSWQDFARINSHTPDLPGIMPEVGEGRFYPIDQEFAHIIGYVASVTDADLENEKDSIIELPDFRIGKIGLEKTFDHQLRGLPGTSRVEINAFGRVIREIQRNSGQQGSSLKLTLNSTLQKYAFSSLQGESGSVVVMDSYTGEILVCVSAPAFDPNKFILGISHNDWNTLINNPLSPMTNKAITGQYPPGSTFKMVVALAGLEAGLIDPKKTVHCTGYIELGTHRFHCWKKKGHGHMNLRKGISRSCDVYFYDLARRVGIKRIAEMARRFGFGSVPDIPMTGVNKGLVPDQNWKRTALGQPWHLGETLNVSIGQGQLLVTPLQLCIMVASIANGSYLVRPVLVSEIDGVPIENPNTKNKSLLNLNKNHIKLVHDAMFSAFNEPYGTGYASAVDLDLGGFSGKTGTVQVRRISRLEREVGLLKNEDRVWKDRDHSVCVGFGPLEKKRYSIAVFIEHGGSGSKKAAKIATNIMTKVFQYHDSTYNKEKINPEVDFSV